MQRATRFLATSCLILRVMRLITAHVRMYNRYILFLVPKIRFPHGKNIFVLQVVTVLRCQVTPVLMQTHLPRFFNSSPKGPEFETDCRHICKSHSTQYACTIRIQVYFCIMVKVLACTSQISKFKADQYDV